MGWVQRDIEHHQSSRKDFSLLKLYWNGSSSPQLQLEPVIVALLWLALKRTEHCKSWLAISQIFKYLLRGARKQGSNRANTNHYQRKPKVYNYIQIYETQLLFELTRKLNFTSSGETGGISFSLFLFILISNFKQYLRILTQAIWYWIWSWPREKDFWPRYQKGSAADCPL